MDVAHGPPLDGAIGEAAAVRAEADGVVDRGAADGAFGATVLHPYPDDRLLEHLLAGGEGPLVRFEVDRLAVARPGEVVDPRAVRLQHSRRSATCRDDGQAARRHQLGAAV